MTPPPDDAAALTDEQIVERLAEFMGWRLNEHGMYDTGRKGNKRWLDARYWKPLRNWNHWRAVEEKIMKHDKLYGTYLLPGVMKACMGQRTRHLTTAEYIGFMAFDYVEADLRTRCLALLASLSSPR